jgi:hypothetical protein
MNTENEMTIPIIPQDEMESWRVGEGMTIPKNQVDKLEDIYIKFFDENKMSYDEYLGLVLYGVLPKYNSH